MLIACIDFIKFGECAEKQIYLPPIKLRSAIENSATCKI